MRGLANRLGPFALLAAAPFVVAGMPPAHLIEGVLATLLTAAMMVPLVAVTLHPAAARRGSLVGAAERRRPWLIAFATTLFMSLLRFDSPTPTVRATMALAGGALALGLAADVRALWRLMRGLAGARWLQLRTAASPPLDAHTVVYDFGVGDEEREELAPPAAIYRERERVVRVVRGTRGSAQRALLRGIAFDVAIVLPTLLTLALVTAIDVYPY